MSGLQETVPVSPRWAPAGHGDGQGARAVISRDKSLHLTIPGAALARGSSNSHRAHEHGQVPSLRTLLQR